VLGSADRGGRELLDAEPASMVYPGLVDALGSAGDLCVCSIVPASPFTLSKLDSLGQNPPTHLDSPFSPSGTSSLPMKAD